MSKPNTWAEQDIEVVFVGVGPPPALYAWNWAGIRLRIKIIHTWVRSKHRVPLRQLFKIIK